MSWYNISYYCSSKEQVPDDDDDDDDGRAQLGESLMSFSSTVWNWGFLLSGKIIHVVSAFYSRLYSAE